MNDPSPLPKDDAGAVYRQRLEGYSGEARRYASRSLLLSRLRLVVAAFSVLSLLAVVVTAGEEPAVWVVASALSLTLFAVLVVIHDRVIRTEARWQGLAELQAEGMARLERDWDRLATPVAEPPDRYRELARDLQLFGRASLLHLLGAAYSPPGRETLVRWLLAGAAPEEVRRRQQGVAALAPALDLRHELALEGRRLAELDPDVEPFLAWAEGEPWTQDRPAWLWTGRLLPVAAWTTGALAFAGVWPAVVPLSLFALAFGVTNLWAQSVGEAHDRVSAREREMAAYADALALLSSAAASAVAPAALESLRRSACAGGVPACERLRQLQRLLDLADARHSALLRLALGTLFLWDLHTLWLLERWQANAGGHARAWLTALGELEALAALAALAFEEPGWAFPRVEPGADRLEARQLAHPLLPASKRVANDVTVGPPGTVLLVTGSNMSGKSTLLRALGANSLLAQAGGPVCADSMVLPPVRLATSILVEDSLEQGISFFMAEVLRVREVVLAARDASPRERGGDGDARRTPAMLYLLDEILRGTNSADRRVAVREVLGRLTALGAIGAVSTHDLALAEEEGLREALVPVHFRETLHPGAGPEEPLMTFDYRLRRGLAPTTNALKLLEMFGLGTVDP